MPPLVVFHTPPPAVATYHVLGSVGWAAMSSMRPEVGELDASGAGPMKLQLVGFSGMEVERNCRSSSRSISKQ